MSTGPTAGPARGGHQSPVALLRRLPLSRWHLPLLAVIAVGTAAATIAQAELLATAIAGPDASVLGWLGVIVVLRATLSGANILVSGCGSARVRRRLRRHLLQGVTPMEAPTVGMGADCESGAEGDAEVTDDGSRVTLMTRGVDMIDPYLTGYLPQLVAAAVLPLAVVVWLARIDPASALTVALTLPLIPILGALVGWHTTTATHRQWRALDRLGGHFLDALAGLATLRSFGRDRNQVHEVRRSAQEFRTTSMSVLRIAFLSAMVLELVAALAVALVAVPLGMRLLDGTVSLQVGLVVLLLTPEAFLPLRALGSAFHTAADARGATDRILPAGATRPVEAPWPRGAAYTNPRVPDASHATIQLDRVTVCYPQRHAPALDRVSVQLPADHTIALAGASGAGKSTLLRLLAGRVTPTSGRVLVDGVDLASLDPHAWRAQLALVPQHPHLFTDTLAANVALRPQSVPTDLGVDRNRVVWALEAAQAGELVDTPGLEARLGSHTRALSAGQLQRVAIARAYYREARMALLDEPTARLDTATATAVHRTVRALAQHRRTIIAAHSPVLLSAVDRVLWLSAGTVSASACQPPPQSSHHTAGERGTRADISTTARISDGVPDHGE
ncbi:thiol reductant ABC exporter subunit CydD [Lipingzhangella sp. LS1_29]|uniref:Thiol reductant ABC exporter subunit CydD n=1 Tax=Lipingzhangella rawalii TaxID=2055835 RepID=A0ABU2H5G2_9ACTN|nr:thiol reductant ABC exporter subunit CydD [Lipingzhangella rawalii]MDS1270554.1 thiol reductant ABC exporter subunit CydD [Lipingzhangella rawalii]